MSKSKHEWKWRYLKRKGVIVPLQRGWFRKAVAEARVVLKGPADFRQVMYYIQWDSLL